MSETTARPIRSKALLAELQKLVKRLLDDLRERSEQLAAVRDTMSAQHQAALEAGATAETYTAWREAQLTQVAVSWVLASVFVRYLEDNGFLDQPVLAGSGDARRRVADRISTYFRANPSHSDREYLQEVFRTVAALPGCHELLGEDRNPLWRVGLSGDGAKELLEFWQGLDPASGELLRPLESPDGDTRFLGDLYQDLSEEARSRFALLQTPVFVEEFILDRVLEPAVVEFGLEKTTLIDPTCGSGHFLLGGFARLLGKWQRAEPGTNQRELARRALEAVHGVDVNPFAVAVARFRLLLAYLRASDIRRLSDCPDVHPRVATGDSLLHGRMVDAKGHPLLEAWPPDVVAAGDYEDAVRMLKATYAAVVGNPPYIIDRDRAHNAAVRAHYLSAYQKFSLGVPFTERFFDLAHPGRSGRAGFVGMITTNSFMKREFGKKLIQDYLPRVDLTHVMDTSGAHIPGHGTPTVILVGRNRPPSSGSVRAVLGIRGEPTTPDEPAQGRVWRSLVDLVDLAGGQNEFVSVSDVSRETLGKHPWSIGGGGAAELKDAIESVATEILSDRTESIGIVSFTLEDDVYVLPVDLLGRKGIPQSNARWMVLGDTIRDWQIGPNDVALFPYDGDFRPDLEQGPLFEQLWPYRTNLKNSKMFGGKTKVEAGLQWFEFGRLTHTKLRTRLSIAFAFVATHNHFVLDRGGKVFKQSAPIIKLPPGASEDDHLALLGLLNSSVACFWIQQVCHNKGGPGGGSSKDEKWHDFYEHDGTKMGRAPIPKDLSSVIPIVTKLDELGSLLTNLWKEFPRTSEELAELESRRWEIYTRQVALQEELDWSMLHLFGLTDTPLFVSDFSKLPALQPGLRAFEFLLARAQRAGDVETRWFEREERVTAFELPSDWPAAYRTVVQHRIDALEQSSDLQLIESMSCKRRWELEPWAEVAGRRLRAWLLDRLETPAYWPDLTLTTCARLADRARRDEDFVQVARLYADKDDIDLTRLVTDLVAGEAVPFLPVFRYKPSGLAKRAEWEKTWALQRREDAGEQVGVIPVPPKYASADYAQSQFWRLRGKLDVPKERFISYPRAERETDPSPVVGWAGWDALEQAQALAAYYLERKEQDGWTAERLTPLLSGLAELLPWLKQWHNEIHPDFGERMGFYYQSFAEQEARALGTTLEAVRGWTPPTTTATRGRGRKK